MPRKRKHIHQRHPLHPVSSGLQHDQIPCQTGGLTGYVHHPLYSIADDLRQRLGMDPIPGRVQDDQIRLLLQRIQYLQNVTGNEITVGKPVEGGVLSGRLHGFFYDLHSGHMLRHRRQDLGDGPSAAVKIEHLLPAGIPYVLAHCIVKHLRPQGIGLEEGKWSDLKFQSQKLLIKIVLSIQHVRTVIENGVCQTVIFCMKDPCKGAGKGQCQKDLLPSLQKLLLGLLSRPGIRSLCRGHKIRQDLPGPHSPADQKVS